MHLRVVAHTHLRLVCFGLLLSGKRQFGQCDRFMRSFKTNPLPTVLLIILLGLVIVILILPEVDLPDTAFQRNSSPTAVHCLSHQPSRAVASVGFSRVGVPGDGQAFGICRVRQGDTGDLQIVTVQRETLRC